MFLGVRFSQNSHIVWLNDHFYLTLKVRTTLLTDIPAPNMSIARFRWCIVKRPIYDASTGDQIIGFYHVNTTTCILTFV